MLRLYGLMTVTERTSLKSGQALPVSSFSPKAQAIIRQMLFGAGTKLQSGPEKEASMFGMFAGMGMGGPRYKTYREEATELMPNGVPAGAVVRLQTKASHFVMPTGDKSGMFGMMMGAMGPQEYAMIKYFSEEPNMAQAAAMMPKLDKFKVGDRDTLDFRILVAGDVYQKHTLIDSRIDKNAAIVGLDALPADFMAEVDKQMKMYKEGFGPLMQMGQMFGGQGVPPR